MKIRKAIIPAAGLGTRFLPATKSQPKEMLPIVDKPAIQYIVEEAIESGIEDILIVTGKNKRAIEDHFDRSAELENVLREKGDTELLRIVQQISNMADIHYIRQKETLGLGHAIYCARKFIGHEPFAVLLGDDIILSEKPGLKQMIEAYEQWEAPIVGVQEVPWEAVNKYGIVTPETDNVRPPTNHLIPIQELVEKPPVGQASSNLAIIGRYILRPEIFGLLEQATPGNNGEIQLTDSLCRLNERYPMLACRISGKRYDVGDKLGYIQATIEIALQREDLRHDLTEYIRSILY